MEFIKDHKRTLLAATAIFIVACIVIFYFYQRGRTSQEILQNLDPGITQEKVIEYAGRPKTKVIDTDEILNWAPEEMIKRSEDLSPLEMYVYNYDRGEARLFFSKGYLVYKHPLRLNMSEEDYFNMYLNVFQ